VVHGADAGEALRAISAVASLLVVGSSSDQPVPARGALGSTARSLVGHTSCPLVLAPYEVARVLPARW
jgi:nucleotide-binding universal stress UspA family protein